MTDEPTLLGDTTIRHGGTIFAHMGPCSEDCYIEVKRLLEAERAKVAELTAPADTGDLERARDVAAKIYSNRESQHFIYLRDEIARAIAQARAESHAQAHMVFATIDLEKAHTAGRIEMRELAAAIAQRDWEDLVCPEHYSGVVARARAERIAAAIRALPSVRPQPEEQT